MKTEFGFKLGMADTYVNGGFLQHMIANKLAKQVCTLLNTRYVINVPDASEDIDNIMCRVFKDVDGDMYVVFISYDTSDNDCLFNLNDAYRITRKTYDKVWYAYKTQVENVRDNMNRSHSVMKQFTNDLYGESYGIYSKHYKDTGEQLPTAARKLYRSLANCYKFMYFDDRII